MNEDNRATKIFLKSLAPNEALKLFEEYNIPSPYKEVLITVCINRKEGFAGIDFLEENFKISLGYWTFGRRLKEGLEIFRKSHKKPIICQLFAKN